MICKHLPKTDLIHRQVMRHKIIELKSYAMQTLTKNWLNSQTSDASV